MTSEQIKRVANRYLGRLYWADLVNDEMTAESLEHSQCEAVAMLLAIWKLDEDQITNEAALPEGFDVTNPANVRNHRLLAQECADLDSWPNGSEVKD